MTGAIQRPDDDHADYANRLTDAEDALAIKGMPGARTSPITTVIFVLAVFMSAARVLWHRLTAAILANQACMSK